MDGPEVTWPGTTVTPAWKFGVKLCLQSDDCLVGSTIRESIAAYEDGKPRQWQERGDDAYAPIKKRLRSQISRAVVRNNMKLAELQKEALA